MQRRRPEKKIDVFEGRLASREGNEVECKACGSEMGLTIYPREKRPNKKVYTCWICKNKWTCAHVDASVVSRFGREGAVLLVNENPRGDRYGKMAFIKAFGKEEPMTDKKPIYMVDGKVVSKSSFREKIKERRRTLSSIALS